MAGLPNQRIAERCPPQEPDETHDNYFVRWKAHRDAWRQQFLGDFYRSKETRLPSPRSEEGLDEEEIAQAAFLIEQDIRIENGLAEPGDLPNPVVWPSVEYPPGKSLSEIGEYEPGPYSPVPRGRPEDNEFDPQLDSSPIPESISMLKRSKSPAENGALKPSAKGWSRDTTSGVPLAGASTLSRKRKRAQFDEPQVTREQAQADPKRRKTDTHSWPLLASVTSSSKRDRGSDEVSGAKRRKFDKDTVTNNVVIGRDFSRTSRVTRAQRRQLSGKDAQLFQLGERGQLNLQRQA